MKCLSCGKKLISVIDPKTKKKSKYLFTCKCMPNKYINIG